MTLVLVDLISGDETGKDFIFRRSVSHCYFTPHWALRRGSEAGKECQEWGHYCNFVISLSCNHTKTVY